MRAGLVAGSLLFALYIATAAPEVTFWDAGEFVAAFATLGVPHPPGTPLFVCLGRAWALALGAFGTSVATSAALLSAACTAGAGGVTATLLARWTGSVRAGVAAALTAGTMHTVWASATEPEVYAPALLLVTLALLAADAAGRGGVARPDAGAARPRGPGSRRTVAAAYALGLAAPLHLSALACAPVVAWLAGAPPGWRPDGRRPVRWARLAVLVAAATAAAGLGTARAEVALPALALLAVAAAYPAITSDLAPSPRVQRATGREALGAAAAVLAAVSGLVILLVRARHDPWLNQGAPSTWATLGDVVARRQYAPAGPWPRQAPPWLQLANLFEWADWQVAFGLDAGAAPGWRRTPWTLAYAALGLTGGAWHRRRDSRSFVAWALLLVCGTAGVAAYLNLKAGPSFGVGVLPLDAPHEARERDYFFTLGWWAWGAWAGLGALLVVRRAARGLGRRGRALAGRRPRLTRPIGLAVAALPAALNWRVDDRRREPARSAARAYAHALLAAAPPRAVLLVRADNDTYPLWAAQAAEGVRTDVTPVTLSLLPAPWYRAELARRHALLPQAVVDGPVADALARRAIADAARAQHRPLVASLAVDGPTLEAAGGVWAHAGLLVGRVPDGTSLGATYAPASPGLAAVAGVGLVDTAAVRRAAALVGPVDAWGDVAQADALDPVVRWSRRQLACPSAILRGAVWPAAALLAVDAPRVEGPCQAR